MSFLIVSSSFLCPSHFPLHHQFQFQFLVQPSGRCWMMGVLYVYGEHSTSGHRAVSSGQHPLGSLANLPRIRWKKLLYIFKWQASNPGTFQMKSMLSSPSLVKYQDEGSSNEAGKFSVSPQNLLMTTSRSYLLASSIITLCRHLILQYCVPRLPPTSLFTTHGVPKTQMVNSLA